MSGSQVSMSEQDSIEWQTVQVAEARVRGATYRIEAPPGCGGRVNVYRNGEFVGPSEGFAAAKAAIEAGLT